MLQKIVPSAFDRKDRRFVSFDEEFAVSEIELSQSMDIEDDVKCLMEAIYQISPIYRDVLILKSLHGYSNREIAAAYQVSENVIRKRMERARLKLKQILERR